MSVDPVSAGLMVGGMAASAAGSAMNSGSSAKRTGAINAGRDRLMREEIARQNGFSAEAWPIFQGYLDQRGYGANTARVGQAVADRNAVTNVPLTSPVTVGGVPGQVNSEINRQTQNVGQVVARNAEGKNKFEAYGDVAARDGVNRLRAGTQLETINNFSRGSSSILPAEFESSDYNAARENQDDPFGGLLKALGMGASLFGSMRPASAPFGSIDELMAAKGIAG